VRRRRRWQSPLSTADIDLAEALDRVLRLPTVASKSFLITIGDRSVTGLVARDQMVGPWQVPVADCAVTLVSYDSNLGEAMAMGERTPVALLDARLLGVWLSPRPSPTSRRAASPALGDVRLSANWMCAAGESGEGAALYDTVRALGRILPGAGHCHPGRQGLDVDADPLAGRRG
jgi:phosphoribosylformylglycinamidine synthase